MSHLNLSLVQTGRSTRMRERAVEMAYRGRAVYILVVNSQMAKLETNLINDLWYRLNYGPTRTHGIKVEAFDHHWQDNWDWASMKPFHGFNENCIFLMDHYVIEMKIKVLQDLIKDCATLAGSLYRQVV